MLARKLDGDFSSCRTRRIRLVGGEMEHLEAYRKKKHRQYASVLSADAVDHLVNLYGTEIDALMDMVQGRPELEARLSPECETLAVEVVHAVRSEMARRLEDVVFRRTGLGDLGHPGTDALRRCAELVARERDWNEERMEEELRSTEARFLWRTLGGSGGDRRRGIGGGLSTPGPWRSTRWKDGRDRKT